MGLLDNFGSKVGTYLGDKENRLNLASGFASMSGNPNTASIMAGIQGQKESLMKRRDARGAQDLANDTLKRHTDMALQILGNKFPEISQLLTSGILTPQEAITESRKPPAERKMFKGADDFNYYTDDKSRVLPDLELPIEKEGELVRQYRLAQEQGYKGTFIDFKTAIAKAGANQVSIDNRTGSTIAPAKPPDGMTNVTDIDSGIVTQVPIKGGVVDIGAQKQVTNANNALATIDSALNHPGLNAAVGSIDSKFVSLSPDAVAFEAYHDQIKGKAFLAAFESLKGGGQITEVEGLKAEQATARLNLAQDEEDYKKALMDLKSVINDVLKRNQNVLDSIPASNNADPLGLR